MNAGNACHLTKAEYLPANSEPCSDIFLMVKSNSEKGDTMPSKLVEELRDFHRFLADKLSADGIDLSPEEALDEWRRLHPQTQSFGEDVAAIQEALDDMDKGDRGIPFDQFDRDFRTRHNLPT
jgi:hypothetical protein